MVRNSFFVTMNSSPRKPRFKIGDSVRLVGPTTSAGTPRSGRVVEITGTVNDPIFRYRVVFSDGASQTFFGFELDLDDNDPT
jgi:hypothetical protein